MAPKQKRPSPLSDSEEEEDLQPLPQQPDHRQGEEEEETSSDEDDDEGDQPASQTPQPHPAKPSSSDSATGSDSDSDLPPPKLKSLPSTKPKDQTPKSKPQSSSSVQPKSASKRAAENNGHTADPKRAKKASKDSSAAAPASDDDDEEEEEDAKKPSDKKLFQRLFSEEDEIAILKGMVEFRAKMNGADPLKSAEAFHDFLKGSNLLGADASSNQLKRKMRTLKKKFENNAGKGKNGEGPSFGPSKRHEQKSFELSKKVWGRGEEASSEKEKSLTDILEKKASNSKSAAKKPAATPKPESKTKPSSEPQPLLTFSKESGKTDEKTGTSLAVSSMIRFDKAMGNCGLDEDFARTAVELIEPSKRAELEGKWRELEDAEFELIARRAQLVAEQYKLISQAKKSSSKN